MSPAEAMTLGPVVMVAGGAALLIFRLYIQFVLTALKKVFPAARGIEVGEGVLELEVRLARLMPALVPVATTLARQTTSQTTSPHWSGMW